jgi:hypothetical protein
MRELPRPAPNRTPPLSTSARLARETGALALRLATLLEAAGPLAPQGTALRNIASAGVGEDGAADAAHPLDRLTRALGLSRFEIDLLVLAGLAEQHEAYAAVLRAVHPRGEPRPTLGLAARLLCESDAERDLMREALHTGSLVVRGAVRLDGDAPFFERSLLPAAALWPALHGLDVWPPGVTRLRRGTPHDGLAVWLTSPALAWARASLGRAAPCTVLVTADSEDMAVDRALALAAHVGLPSVPLAVDGAVGAEAEPLIALHTLARGVTPVLRLATPEGAGGTPSPLPAFGDYPRPVIVCGRHGSAMARGARPVISVAAERLATPQRQAVWSAALPELAAHAPMLAARYSVEPEVVAGVAADLRSLAAAIEGPPTLEHAAASMRVRAGAASASGTRLQCPTASWDNLVLPPERLAQLREAVSRLLHQDRVIDKWGFLRGRPGARGVRMLFAGPPGTGKTLSAEVLARELGVDLMIVDIARVVSKWIGETEQNLARVFDAAEQAQAVLLFDEADALFGRRTEVSDAHDRYANLETAYLLSRMERFEGLTVLATNLRQNLDPAFIRRLEFVLDFEEPSLREREALWRAHLPPGAPLAPDVDLHALALGYPLVGALIRNAAVGAAFLAAAEDTAIANHHLTAAIRREYQKAGRAFPGGPGTRAGTRPK